MRPPPPTEGQERWRGRAFGLDVEAPCPILGLARTGRAAAGRRTRLELVSPAALERAWRPREAVCVLERSSGSRRIMTIGRHPHLGYRVYAPRHGRHVVSADGRSVRSALPSVPPWRWQRLLFAQVLPLAATLQGLELFHASAVELDGGAVGFVAASGTGKTSVAVHLVGRGCTLLTDDVLALEPVRGEVLAHPGAGLASVPAAELRSLGPAGRRRLGEAVGRSDKVHVAARLSQRAVPLRAMYFLTRSATRGALEIEGIPPDGRLLLSSGFIAYVNSSDHLTHHLDVCAQLAASVPGFRVAVPGSCTAARVAAHIAEHVGAL